MDNSERTVVGVFMEREKAVREIQRLHNEGYKQSEISVYSNPERARTVERLMGIDVEDVDVSDVETDTSWWDTIKNSFRFFVFDADEADNRVRAVDDPKKERLAPLDDEAIRKTTGLLDPYRKDLAEGKLVIVVKDYGRHNRL